MRTMSQTGNATVTAIATVSPSALSSTGSSTNAADSAPIANAPISPSSRSIRPADPMRSRASSTIATTNGTYMPKYSQSASEGIGTTLSSSWITHHTSPAHHDAIPSAIRSQTARCPGSASARHAASTAQPAITPL